MKIPLDKQGLSDKILTIYFEYFFGGIILCQLE